MILRY